MLKRQQICYVTFFLMNNYFWIEHIQLTNMQELLCYNLSLTTPTSCPFCVNPTGQIHMTSVAKQLHPVPIPGYTKQEEPISGSHLDKTSTTHKGR